jgi:metallothionein
MTEAKKCAHPACNCVPAEHHKYCSQTCQDAKSLTELVCQCDHPGCRSEALKPSV